MSKLSKLAALVLAFTTSCTAIRPFFNQDYCFEKPNERTRMYNGLRTDFPKNAKQCGFTLEQITSYNIKIDPIKVKEVDYGFQKTKSILDKYKKLTTGTKYPNGEWLEKTFVRLCLIKEYRRPKRTNYPSTLPFKGSRTAIIDVDSLEKGFSSILAPLIVKTLYKKEFGKKEYERLKQEWQQLNNREYNPKTKEGDFFPGFVSHYAAQSLYYDLVSTHCRLLSNPEEVLKKAEEDPVIKQKVELAIKMLNRLWGTSLEKKDFVMRKKFFL